jgi:hypothetical protein
VIVECERCGAPLDVAEGQRAAKCGYCRATHRVKNLRTQEVRTPPNWKPPPVWTPQDHRRHQFPQPMPHNPVGAFAKWQLVQTLLGIAFALVLVVAVAVVAWTKRGNSIAGLGLTTPPTLGSFEVGTVFPVRFERPGVAGGPIDAIRLGPSCRGHFPRAAHAVIRVTQPSQLEITTVGSTDLTMAVRGPDGIIRCDDDSGQGSNPRIQGPFVPGEHRVWIGTYSANQSAPFTLSIQVNAVGSAIDLNGLAPDAPAQFGVLDLERENGSATRQGATAAMVEGSRVNASCRGWYPSAPVANVRIAQPRFLSITTASDGDLTLLVRTPAGQILCDDDSGYGNAPRLETMAAPGVYTVWVGSFSQSQNAPYTLSLASEVVAPVVDAYGFAPDAPPAFGILDLAENTVPTVMRGVALHRVEATALDPSCSGAGFSAAPTVALRTRSARRVTLAAAAPQDHALLVQNAQGVRHCQGRRASSVSASIDLQPGTTLVWIGTSERQRHVPYALTVRDRR